MQEAKPRQIKTYKTKNGKVPYDIWFAEINDKTLQNAIIGRLERVGKGDFGECASVGEGVKELKFRAYGIRIYFAEIAGYVVLLLCSGDKANQTRDLKKAKDYLREFKSRVEEADENENK